MTLKSLLKKRHNSFKKWSLNLWWISKKTIKEVGNITKAATFESILHLSYKNPIVNIVHEKKIKQWFLGVIQKYELCVSFEALLRSP